MREHTASARANRGSACETEAEEERTRTYERGLAAQKRAMRWREARGSRGAREGGRAAVERSHGEERG